MKRKGWIFPLCSGSPAEGGGVSPGCVLERALASSGAGPGFLGELLRSRRQPEAAVSCELWRSRDRAASGVSVGRWGPCAQPAPPAPNRKTPHAADGERQDWSFSRARPE